MCKPDPAVFYLFTLHASIIDQTLKIPPKQWYFPGAFKLNYYLAHASLHTIN